MKKRQIYAYLQRSLLKVLKISINSNQYKTLLTKSQLTIFNLEKLSPLTVNLVNTLYKKKTFGLNCQFFLITFTSALRANQDQDLNKIKFDYSFIRIHQFFHFSVSRESFFYPSSVYISQIIIVRDAQFWKRDFFASSGSLRVFSYLKKNFDLIENRGFVFKQPKQYEETVFSLFYYKKTYCDSVNKKFLNFRKGFYHLDCFLLIPTKHHFFTNHSFFEPLPLLDSLFSALINTKKVLYKEKLIFSNLFQFNSLTPNKFLSLKSFSQKITVITKTNFFYFYLMRPLFSVTRLDTFSICETLQLPIYPDKSNLRVDFLRNRVRKQILPAIRILLNPQFDTLLCKFNDSE